MSALVCFLISLSGSTTRARVFSQIRMLQKLASFAQMAPLELLKECMPHTFHVHAKAHMFDDKGLEPSTPYDRLIAIIKESGYDGYISAEFEGWMLKEVDSKEIVSTHVNLIRRYL